MNKKILFIGAGHAHLHSLNNLRTIAETESAITVINRSPYFYYAPMMPAMLAGHYDPGDIRIDIRDLVQNAGGRFIESDVVCIDPAVRTVRLTSGEEITYDIVSFNIGSMPPAIPADAPVPVYTAKPFEVLIRLREDICNRSESGTLRIAVIGGGGSGVEIAAALRRLIADRHIDARITLITQDPLLARFSPRLRDLAFAALHRQGILIMERSPVTTINGDLIKLENGGSVRFDIAVNATGPVPPRLFADSGLAVGRMGGLVVNRYLQAVDHPEMFGGGDGIAYQPRSLQKSCAIAVQQGPVLFHNILATIARKRLRPFRPARSYSAIIDLGDTGIFCKGSLVLPGAWPLRLKRRNARRFIARNSLN